MHYPLLLLLLVATSASATTTKCTKDVATDYAELLVADVPAEDVEATYALFEAFVDLNTWKLIDEIDGNTDGIKKNDDLSCTPHDIPQQPPVVKHSLTLSQKYRQLR